MTRSSTSLTQSKVRRHAKRSHGICFVDMKTGKMMCILHNSVLDLCSDVGVCVGVLVV